MYRYVYIYIIYSLSMNFREIVINQQLTTICGYIITKIMINKINDLDIGVCQNGVVKELDVVFIMVE